MSKDRTDSPSPLSPLFAMWRATLDELERNAELIGQQGAQRLEEAAAAMRQVRNQVLAASRGAIDAAERLAADAAQAGKGFAKGAQ